jgi:Transcriptional regulator
VVPVSPSADVEIDGDPEDQPAGDGERSRDFVRSLERGLTIIRVFNADRPSMTVSEIAQVAGLTRAAVRRFLLTLCELGYVYGKNNRYELTPQVLELGYSYLSALSFPDIALPRLEKLVAETSEASEGSILDRGDVVYVVRVPGPALMTISVNIGARRPAHATAMGRVLLANLPTAELEDYLQKYTLTPALPRTITDPDLFRAELRKVREEGYALVNQELEEGWSPSPCRSGTGWDEHVRRSTSPRTSAASRSRKCGHWSPWCRRRPPISNSA